MILKCGMRSAECGIKERLRRGLFDKGRREATPKLRVPRSAFRISRQWRLQVGENCHVG